MTATENPYLAGNYAPVADERTTTDLDGHGRDPARARRARSCATVRTRSPPTRRLPLVHRRRHAARRRARATGGARGTATVGSAPTTRARALGEAAAPGQPADVSPAVRTRANTHVVGHAGPHPRARRGCLPDRAARPTSTTVRPLPTSAARCARRSPRTRRSIRVTGEMLFFGYGFPDRRTSRYHVVDATGALVRSEPITIAGPVMMHDFAITETTCVFFDLPGRVRLRTARTAAVPVPRGTPEHGARVGVMPRDGGDADVRWFDVDPCYVFHPMNAYDDGDARRASTSPRTPTMFDARRPARTTATSPTLERWTIDLAARQGRRGAARRARPGVPARRRDVARSRPPLRLRDRTSTAVERSSGNGAAQARLRRAAPTERHDFGPGARAGEFVFVPASDATPSEDDGWVLRVRLRRGHRPLRPRDPRRHDFTAPPVATVHLPPRVPFGFHGIWVGRSVAARAVECRRRRRPLYACAPTAVPRGPAGRQEGHRGRASPRNARTSGPAEPGARSQAPDKGCRRARRRSCSSPSSGVPDRRRLRRRRPTPATTTTTVPDHHDGSRDDVDPHTTAPLPTTPEGYAETLFTAWQTNNPGSWPRSRRRRR